MTAPIRSDSCSLKSNGDAMLEKFSDDVPPGVLGDPVDGFLDRALNTGS